MLQSLESVPETTQEESIQEETDQDDVDIQEPTPLLEMDVKTPQN